ncbi:MAG TPA: hypothetical protein ENK23_02985 [Sorangium sp.]|nr:hypothetical protein [Sorangium sp.]
MTPLVTTTPGSFPASAAHRQEEAAAAQAAATGGWWARTRIGASALRKLLADPEDTHQVFVMSMAINAGALPRMLERFLRDDSGLQLLQRRAAITSQHIDFGALGALPANTLGGAYARFLRRNNLNPDLFQPPPTLPPAAAYLVQRLRQTHDLWHVLTGYDTDIGGELSILGFTYAQTGAPSIGLIAALGAMRYSLDMPNIIPRVYRAYRRGQAAQYLGNVPWESMWSLPLTQVKQQLGVA